MTDVHFGADSMDCIDGGAPMDPVCGPPAADEGDTWITVGDAESEDERTVTVVFRRDPLEEADPLDEIETGEFLVRPLVPKFPDRG